MTEYKNSASYAALTTEQLLNKVKLPDFTAKDYQNQRRYKDTETSFENWARSTFESMNAPIVQWGNEYPDYLRRRGEELRGEAAAIQAELKALPLTKFKFGDGRVADAPPEGWSGDVKPRRLHAEELIEIATYSGVGVLASGLGATSVYILLTNSGIPIFLEYPKIAWIGAGLPLLAAATTHAVIDDLDGEHLKQKFKRRIRQALGVCLAGWLGSLGTLVMSNHLSGDDFLSTSAIGEYAKTAMGISQILVEITGVSLIMSRISTILLNRRPGRLIDNADRQPLIRRQKENAEEQIENSRQIDLTTQKNNAVQAVMDAFVRKVKGEYADKSRPFTND